MEDNIFILISTAFGKMLMTKQEDSCLNTQKTSLNLLIITRERMIFLSAFYIHNQRCLYHNDEEIYVYTYLHMYILIYKFVDECVCGIFIFSFAFLLVHIIVSVVQSKDICVLFSFSCSLL